MFQSVITRVEALISKPFKKKNKEPSAIPGEVRISQLFGQCEYGPLRTVFEFVHYINIFSNSIYVCKAFHTASSKSLTQRKINRTGLDRPVGECDVLTNLVSEEEDLIDEDDPYGWGTLNDDSSSDDEKKKDKRGPEGVVVQEWEYEFFRKKPAEKLFTKLLEVECFDYRDHVLMVFCLHFALKWKYYDAAKIVLLHNSKVAMEYFKIKSLYKAVGKLYRQKHPDEFRILQLLTCEKSRPSAKDFDKWKEVVKMVIQRQVIFTKSIGRGQHTFLYWLCSSHNIEEYSEDSCVDLYKFIFSSDQFLVPCPDGKVNCFPNCARYAMGRALGGGNFALVKALIRSKKTISPQDAFDGFVSEQSYRTYKTGDRKYKTYVELFRILFEERKCDFVLSPTDLADAVEYIPRKLMKFLFDEKYVSMEHIENGKVVSEFFAREGKRILNISWLLKEFPQYETNLLEGNVTKIFMLACEKNQVELIKKLSKYEDVDHYFFGGFMGYVGSTRAFDLKTLKLFCDDKRMPDEILNDDSWDRFEIFILSCNTDPNTKEFKYLWEKMNITFGDLRILHNLCDSADLRNEKNLQKVKLFLNDKRISTRYNDRIRWIYKALVVNHNRSNSRNDILKQAFKKRLKIPIKIKDQ